MLIIYGIHKHSIMFYLQTIYCNFDFEYFLIGVKNKNHIINRTTFFEDRPSLNKVNLNIKSQFIIRTYLKIHLIQKICKDCPVDFVDFVQNKRGSPCNFFCIRWIFKYVLIKNGLYWKRNWLFIHRSVFEYSFKKTTFRYYLILGLGKNNQMRSPTLYLDQKFVNPTLRLQNEKCYFIDLHYNQILRGTLK